MSLPDWEEMRSHLSQVQPTMERFRAEFGFVYPEASSVGKYPRIRIETAQKVNHWFDLWMDLDGDGQYFTSFNPERPYSLSAGACFVVEEDGTTFRHQSSFSCFEGLPFRGVPEGLDSMLRSNFPRLMEMTSSWLVENGERIRLAG